MERHYRWDLISAGYRKSDCRVHANLDGRHSFRNPYVPRRSNARRDQSVVLQLGSPTGLYGAERWIIALAKHLRPDQVESIVGTIKDAPGDVPPLCRQAAAMGLRTEVFESHGKLSLTAVRLLNAFIRANRIDILHTHGYKTDILGWAAVRSTGCKAVSTPSRMGTRAESS